MFADDTTIPLSSLYVEAADPTTIYTDGRSFVKRFWLDTSTGAIGTLKKRNAANTGWDTLINLDAPTLANDSITNALLANMAQATIKGRAAGAGTGDPTDLTAAQVKTILAIAPSDVTGFDTQVRTSRLDQMAAPTADVSLNSHKLTSVTDPSGAQDAATKAYVDSQIKLLQKWALNFTANGDAYIPAYEAMTVDVGTVAIGTGTLAYEKSTTASPGTFSSTSLPATLQAGAWLKVSVSSLTGFKAVELKRTA